MNLFKEVANKETFSNSFLESNISLIPKPEKVPNKTELQANFSSELRCKSPQQDINKQKAVNCQEDYIP